MLAYKIQAYLMIVSALKNFTGQTAIDFNTKGTEVFIFVLSYITVSLSENCSVFAANDQGKSNYIHLLLTSITKSFPVC